MAGRPIGPFLVQATAPVYLVGDGPRTEPNLSQRLRQNGLTNPVERVSPESLSTVAASAPGGVVCLCSPPADRPSNDRAERDGVRDGKIGAREVIERVAATGVDCPVLPVGEGLDIDAHDEELTVQVSGLEGVSEDERSVEE